jgi:hypothetical protein
MRSKLVQFVPYLIALMILSASAFSAPNTPQVAVLSSSDASGQLSLDRLSSCYVQLAREWKVDVKALPNVIALHVSKKAAQAAGVQKKVDVRRNRSAAQDDGYYELWLVESPNLPDIVLGLDNIIEDHFRLNPPADQRKEVMSRVMRIQSATVSVYEGK